MLHIEHIRARIRRCDISNSLKLTKYEHNGFHCVCVCVEQVESGGWSSSSLLVIAVVHLLFIGGCFRYERCSAQFDFLSVNVGRMCRTLLGIRCGQLHNDNDDCDSIVWRTNVSAREAAEGWALVNGKKYTENNNNKMEMWQSKIANR